MAQQEVPVRSEKRYLNQSTVNASNKRRAPYALRACNACRKRKGRCDGAYPCEYCNGRSMECVYSEDKRSDELAALANAGRSSGHERADSSSLSDLVLSMQGQLAALTAQVQASVGRPPSQTQQPESNNTRPQQTAHSVAASESDSGVVDMPVANTARRSSKRYVGPTSADYSFNVAESKTTSSGHARRDSTQSKLPSIEEGQSSDEAEFPEHISTPASALSHSSQTTPATLFYFTRLMDQNEALRLVHVYSDVIGELHPIYSPDRLEKDIGKVYNWPRRQSSPKEGHPPPLNDMSLLIINLTLCIALCTEPGLRPAQGREIFSTCEALINAKIASASLGVKQVTLALMVGFYHFFMGRVPLALRMCGIAGRLAMELGLHNRDASQQYPDEDQSHDEVVAISYSLIVLDRNWSAATGLPPNFQVTDFELATKSNVRTSIVHNVLKNTSANDSQIETPYLKAMMAFTIISQRFNEPISRAARGEMFQDDDAFDLLNFQVEQWRKRAISDHNFIHPDRWESMPGKRPPTWTLILYLRANAVKCILLRPFFLTQELSEATRRNISPALHNLTDSINSISILDSTTDIYRKQHPLFSHFLAVSSALLFLLVTYVEQHRHSIAAELPHNFPDTVKDNYWKALRISAKYSGSFAASRRLWRRLVTMRATLCSLGILSPQQGYVEVVPGMGNAAQIQQQQQQQSQQQDQHHQQQQQQQHQHQQPPLPTHAPLDPAIWMQAEHVPLPSLDMDDMASFDLYCANMGGAGNGGEGGGMYDTDFFTVGGGGGESSGGMGDFHSFRYA